jgi:phosphopantetheine adenylyltransferase
MKVKVVSIFTDKYTKKTYKLGDKIEVSKERYNEIEQYVEKIKENKK